MWIVNDRDTRMMLSFLVQWKGNVTDYPDKRTMSFIKELRYQAYRIIIKTDQESPTTAVQDKLAKERGQAHMIIENSPVRSSGSNGVIERGMKESEYHIRSMKSALDERLGMNVGATSCILPWMIEYSLGPTGRSHTRSSRARDRRCSGSSVPKPFCSVGFRCRAGWANLRAYVRAA